MSGITADSVVSLDLVNFGVSSPNAYRIVQWPAKVTVTSICFTINTECVGSEEDAREWTCYAVKGRKARSENPGDVGFTDEDIVPFFGDNEKPTVITADTRFVSTVGMPISTGQWYTPYQAYIGNVAQMDPDEYLTIWIEGTSGDFDTLDDTATWGTISIAYTGSASNI